MAAVLRSSILRIAPAANLLSKQLPCIHQAAGISSKVLRDLKGIKRPPPYDYKNKPYNFIRALFDKTTQRLDENSKVIVVEGPIGAGKTKFAKELAEELDMLYVPPADMNYYYITSYGFDLRTLDPKLTPQIRTFDTNDFLKAPNDRRTAVYQSHMFKLRYKFYIEALGHLFSTGQGIVTERSPFSDSVFVETLYRHDLISKLAHKALVEIHDNTIQELLRPHLIIYLDVPVDVVQQRIKERNNPAEVNSVLFKDNKYLQTMENMYKQHFLKKLSAHAELLVYDWSNGGETELVVEDIERINFESYERDDTKMADWRFMPQEWDWCEERMRYTSDADELYTLMDIPLHYCEELCIEPEDDLLRRYVYSTVPGMEFSYGFNRDVGDTGVLFKNKYTLNPSNSQN